MLMAEGDSLVRVGDLKPRYDIRPEVKTEGLVWMGTFEITRVRPTPHREFLDGYTNYHQGLTRNFYISIKWQDGVFSHACDPISTQYPGKSSDHGIVFTTRNALLDWLIAGGWWEVVNR